jgi:cation transport ATPase
VFVIKNSNFRRVRKLIKRSLWTAFSIASAIGIAIAIFGVAPMAAANAAAQGPTVTRDQM